MDSYRIPSESTGCGSDSVTVYWQIADRTLYLKGSGCVSDFSDVGYHGGIDTIVIEDGVRILESAFDECEHLRYLVLPPDWHRVIVWEDPEEAWRPEDFFYDYPNLMVLTKGEETEVVFISSQLKDAVIPDYATAVCMGCSIDGMESVVIPAGIKEMSGGFTNCERLKSVLIADGVTQISPRAFQNCRALEAVSIPDSVVQIGDSAFEGCINLKTVRLPDKLKSIGEYAFSETGMDELYVPDTVTDIGRHAFDGIYNVIYHGSAPDEQIAECHEENTLIHWHWGAKEINAGPVYGELTDCDLFFCFGQDQEILEFARGNIYIREEEGKYIFGQKHRKGTGSNLVYKDDHWYISPAGKKSKVWINGIPLQYGREYMMHSGDQIALMELEPFTVHGHPVRRLYRDEIVRTPEVEA